MDRNVSVKWAKDAAVLAADRASVERSSGDAARSARVAQLSTVGQRAVWAGRLGLGRRVQPVADCYVGMADVVDKTGRAARYVELRGARLEALQRAAHVAETANADLVAATRDAEQRLAQAKKARASKRTRLAVVTAMQTKHKLPPWRAAIIAKFANTTIKTRLRDIRVRRNNAAVVLQSAQRCRKATYVATLLRAQQAAIASERALHVRRIQSLVRRFLARASAAADRAAWLRRFRAAVLVQRCARAMPLRTFWLQYKHTTKATDQLIARRVATLQSCADDIAASLRMALTSLHAAQDGEDDVVPPLHNQDDAGSTFRLSLDAALASARRLGPHLRDVPLLMPDHEQQP